jgi:hypothetical protein
MNVNNDAFSDINAQAALCSKSNGDMGIVGMSTEYLVRAFNPAGELLWEEKCHNRVVTTGLNQLLDATIKTGVTSPTWYVGICSALVTNGAITSGLAVLTSASNPFVAADAGRAIIVRGAGASTADLVTTILTYTNSGSVTLAANAGTTVTGASVIKDALAASTMASHADWIECTAYTGTRPAFTPGSISAGSVDNSGSTANITINADNTLIGGLFLANNSTIGGSTGTLYGMAPFTIGFRQLNNGDQIQITATLTAAAV